ncbi:hypothetical protein JCGZ_25384 [Jatropha curcas]|uniref:pectinesterase n=1 Tax=Jatropha curcas TaxID=180498 RepID=A0A067JJ47_JATCU|nr:pectinesterase inhibitor 4 [Jatropha curcas]KDP23996.1 hypothetical protein JCGZ_25384 [Jatropha curcas]
METKTQILIFPLLLTFVLFISNTKNTAASTTATATTTTTTAATKTSNKTYRNYLKTACKSTTYPKLCYSSLSSYSSIIKTDDLILCTTALNVSLQISINTSYFMTDLSNQQELSETEAEVVQDCIDEIGDSIYELNQSLSDLSSLDFNSSDVRFQISNIKTWVSAAITDDYGCTDGFDGTKVSSAVKSKIKKAILNVSRITSNALALVNQKLSFP